MPIEIVVVFSDGREEAIRAYANFTEAIQDALKLADDHGNDNEEGSGPPERIQVIRGEIIELNIAVIRGGLLGGTKSNVKVQQERPPTSRDYNRPIP